jgi:hypothetical protein
VELIAQATGQDEAIKKLQVANDNLEREYAGPVKRIEALEARFKAANDNQAAGPKALKTGSGAYKAAHPYVRKPGCCLSLTLRDKRDLFARSERERRDDAPAIVDGIPPGFMVAVVRVPLALFAGFPALAHLVGVGVDEALGLQGFRFAIELDAVVARGSVQPSTFARVHAPGDVRDGRAELVVVERQRRHRRQSKRNRDGDGAHAHGMTADPHQWERHLPPSIRQRRSLRLEAERGRSRSDHGVGCSSGIRHSETAKSGAGADHVDKWVSVMMGP